MLRTTFLFSALLSVSLCAQTGSYTSFGAGCAGSTGTGPGCLSANYTGTWGGNLGVTSFALGANTGSVARVICGFELYAATASGNSSLSAAIHSATAAGGPGSALATTTINWTATPKWHRATFTTPVIIKANTKFFLVFQNPGKLPYMSAGTQTVEHWHSGPAWRGPYSARWNYNVLCCGQTAGAVPALSNTGVPSISNPFSVDLSKAMPNSVALHILGLSTTQWGAIKLPLDLTGAGAPGCNLLVSFVSAFAFPTSATGTASVKYTLPNDKNLIGVPFHNQWAVLDKPANALGLAFSNGGSGKIGT